MGPSNGDLLGWSGGPFWEVEIEGEATWQSQSTAKQKALQAAEPVIQRLLTWESIM